jgi:hypothetical protein
MRPYTSSLYSALRDYKNTHTKRTLPALAHVDVCMWRSYLVMVRFDPENLHRPIESFALRAPSCAFRYDASLHTISCGMYTRESPTHPLVLRGFAVIFLSFPATSEARYQNTLEFLAVVLGVLICIHLRISHRACELFGDSVSSLRWAIIDRITSVIARRTNIAFTLAGVMADITIEKTTYVPGVNNGVYEGLTRGRSAAEVGLPPDRQLYFIADHPIHHIIQLCNPQDPLHSTLDHSHLSQQLLNLFRDPLSFTSSPNPSPAPHDPVLVPTDGWRCYG